MKKIIDIILFSLVFSGTMGSFFMAGYSLFMKEFAMTVLFTIMGLLLSIELIIANMVRKKQKKFQCGRFEIGIEYKEIKK